jgi:CRISPR-associated endonuclease/helicase Cas3
MYPTNELIRDQRRQAEQTWQMWNKYTNAVAELDSSVLDNAMESGDFGTRGEALLGLMRNYDVVLTNPDIFHYIMQLFYRREGTHSDAPDRIIGPLIQLFQQFTFDEFHVFETPQVVSVLNALLFIHEMTGKHRRQFLFQSATPNPLLLDYLERAGLRTQVIQGQYHHDNGCPDTDKWRRILHGSTIYFNTGTGGTVETWLDENLEKTLLPFFQRNLPGAKGAVIVNSVAQAKRLVQRLGKALQPFGLRVGENTGITSRSRRAESYDCDLLVGTSTVDVGVDFRINFLLFESRDSGSFLQRLGRLGRHNGFERDGVIHPFQEFVAHAVLPPWIVEALFQGRDKEPAPLQNGMETDRETLTKAIEWAFPQLTDFAGYAQAWGGLQSARVLKGFNAYMVQGQYQESVQSLARRYQAAFRVSMNGQLGRLRSLTKNQKPLLEEAIAFRGGSYFTCGVLDMTEDGKDQIKTYDLFSLIANGDLGLLDEDEYWQVIDRAGLPRRPFERQSPIGFFRLWGFRSERTNYNIVIERDLMGWSAEHFGVATVLTGVTVDADSVPGLSEINRRLQRHSFPALICLGQQHPIELKRRLRLPLLFQVFAFKSRDHLRGTVAFGREALLLDVTMRHRGIDCGGGAIFA